jgi:hypothetical protein
VDIYGFQHVSIAGSGLSRMFMEGANEITFLTPADLWVSMRMLLEEKPDEKMYVWAYWGAVDGLSHFKGPDDPRPAAEFFHFSQAFEKYFLNELSAEARKDTIVVLAADHGQITTNNLDPHYQMVNHPNLMRRLHMQPTGENRLAYLYIKPGQTEAVREYVERTWPNQFAIVESAYALEKGLFGPGKPHEMMLDRIGELILAGRKDAYLWWATKNNFLIGRHGGLHPEEMLVPFLGARLG